MNAIILTFIFALVFSLVLTPAAKWLGNSLGALDEPAARKVHTKPIPRIGGLAILLSFFLALIVTAIFIPCPSSSDYFSTDTKKSFVLLGGLLIFGVGFFDDFHRLKPSIKFLGQILAASLAYYGGLRIEVFALGTVSLQFGFFSYLITVFWFLLLINAMNLIDGLDGLAAGIGFFTCFVMAIMGTMQNDYLVALEFAAIAGVLLGFLRYNFNPASIFMGDGGSYFIGYTIAALSIQGSLKSGLAATLLIPLLALGVPIFDTLLSPIRRWVLGQRMFYPDKGHIHHYLVEKGLSSRRVVFIIYGISLLLCITGIILINIRNSIAGGLMAVMFVVLFLVVRKLGYLEYVAIDKFSGWFRDISYEAGLMHGRRSFLSVQIQIEHSQNMEELWENVCQALEIMHFDKAELSLNCADKFQAESNPVGKNLSRNDDAEESENAHGKFLRVWTHEDTGALKDVPDQDAFRIEIPLSSKNSFTGKLVMIKNINLNPLEPHTLRRVEYLRRSLTVVLKGLKC